MSDTLVKDRDVIVYRNEASYSHNAVVELLQNGEMVCSVQEQARRKYRTHYDPTSRAVLLRSQDNGSMWDPGTKTVIAEAENEAVVDPGIKQLRDGTLIVTYFKWRMGGDDEVPTDESPEDEGTGKHFANSAGGTTWAPWTASTTSGGPARTPSGRRTTAPPGRSPSTSRRPPVGTPASATRLLSYRTASS